MIIYHANNLAAKKGQHVFYTPSIFNLASWRVVNPPIGTTFFQTLSSDGTGVATMNEVYCYARTLAAFGTGEAFILKGISKTLAASGTGAATLIKNIGKTLASDGTGVSAITRNIGKTLASSGTGVATLINGFVHDIALSSFGTGVSTLVTNFIAFAASGGMMGWFRRRRR